MGTVEIAAKAAIPGGFKNATKHAYGTPKDGEFSILLKPEVELDQEARKLLATCKWEVFKLEGTTKKMFPAARMDRPATGYIENVNPARVDQGMVDDVVAGAVETAVSGILKKLP